MKAPHRLVCVPMWDRAQASRRQIHVPYLSLCVPVSLSLTVYLSYSLTMCVCICMVGSAILAMGGSDRVSRLTAPCLERAGHSACACAPICARSSLHDYPSNAARTDPRGTGRSVARSECRRSRRTSVPSLSLTIADRQVGKSTYERLLSAQHAHARTASRSLGHPRLSLSLSDDNILVRVMGERAIGHAGRPCCCCAVCKCLVPICACACACRAAGRSGRWRWRSPRRSTKGPRPTAAYDAPAHPTRIRS